MTALHKTKRLKKELTLLNVYAIATGTILSGGFFLLPGIAAAQAGPAMILSYLIAALPLIPAMLCQVELATAMPRAGGVYYFLDRSMGPLMGTIGGLGTWISLTLKTAFALIGMGAYLNLFIQGDYLLLIAVAFAVLFGIINLIGAKETGAFQVFLVVGILLLLGGFIVNGSFHVNFANFSNFFDAGAHSITATAGLVYISYIGVTKVASLSEDVKDPERNLPLGMFLGFGTALLIYALGTYVMVGVLPKEQLNGNLTPVASVAEAIAGTWGKIAVTIAAVFAFSSVTNAGILSASRYPFAMSRDHLLPRPFRKLDKRNIPVNSVVITVAVILVYLFTLDPVKIAKLASTFQLLLFALCCLAVVIMRESKIEAYDPGFRSPFYPWLPILGMVLPFWFIIEMGWMPALFSAGLIGLSILWYFWYAQSRIKREGAVLHVFERLGRGRDEGLESELRGILKEKGLRDEDPFPELIMRAKFLELETTEGFDDLIKRVSELLSKEVSYPHEEIEKGFMEGTKVGATPVSHGAALPHMRLHHIIEPELFIVRSKVGIKVDMGGEFWGDFAPTEPLKAVFFLVSPEENPRQHLRILAKLAELVDDDHFMDEWLAARDEQKIKEMLLRDENFISLQLRSTADTADWIGKKIKELGLPENCLIAVIRREGETIVPRGSTILGKNDRVTLIGDTKGIQKLRAEYGSG